MARAGLLIGGIFLLLFGIVLFGTIFLAPLGVLLAFIGFIMLIVGAVTSPPRPQVVLVQQPAPIYYPPPTPQFAYNPNQPVPPPVMVNVQPAVTAPPPPQIMRRCSYCNAVYSESLGKCPQCGAGF